MDEVEVGGLRIAYERAGDGSPLVILSGVGHVSSVEAAERFNAEVRSFLHESVG